MSRECDPTYQIATRNFGVPDKRDIDNNAEFASAVAWAKWLGIYTRPIPCNISACIVAVATPNVILYLKRQISAHVH
jgi:hypothetical protein